MKQTIEKRLQQSKENLAKQLQQLQSNDPTMTVFKTSNIVDCSFQDIGDALKTNTNVSSFKAFNLQIGNNGAALLSEVIRQNFHLRHISLPNNQIDGKGIKAILSALQYNSSLLSLHLSRNNIANTDVKDLFSSLPTSSLTSLNLSKNGLDDNGAILLFNALSTNTKLIKIDLSQNNITGLCSDALYNFLSKNSTLASLNLSGNVIEEDCIKALSRALTINKSLTVLYFGNEIAANTQMIDDAIMLNPHIIYAQYTGIPYALSTTLSARREKIKGLIRSYKDQTIDVNKLKTYQHQISYIAEREKLLSNSETLCFQRYLDGIIASKFEIKSEIKLHKDVFQVILDHLNLKDLRSLSIALGKDEAVEVEQIDM
jgi:hypothetical protein